MFRLSDKVKLFHYTDIEELKEFCDGNLYDYEGILYAILNPNGDRIVVNKGDYIIKFNNTYFKLPSGIIREED